MIMDRPEHYAYDIEPIVVLEDWLTHEEYCGFCRGNVLKYIARYKEKGGVDDLKKAQTYLQWLINAETGKKPR